MVNGLGVRGQGRVNGRFPGENTNHGGHRGAESEQLIDLPRLEGRDATTEFTEAQRGYS